VRPYEVAVVPDADGAALNGVVKRVHGFGPARRLEIVLREGDREHFIEVHAPRHHAIGIGQEIGLKPRAYRLFAANADFSTERAVADANRVADGSFFCAADSRPSCNLRFAARSP